MSDALDLFEEVQSSQACDFAVLPFDYGWVINGNVKSADAETFFAEAASVGKKTIVFCWHDEDPHIRDERLIIWQTSFKKRPSSPFRHVLSCSVEDYVERYSGGTQPIRPWREKPVVGFCGRADGKVHGSLDRFWSFARSTKRSLLTGKPSYPYRQLRARCIEAVKNDQRLVANLDVQDAFWGRKEESSKAVTTDEMIIARPRFVANLINCDYVLCPRGAGNFSIRLYEALSLGRIPIVVHCDGLLPFEDKIDWDRFIVRISPQDVGQLGDAVMVFHEARRAEFTELQLNIRRLWQTYFEPSAFFVRLVETLRSDMRSRIEVPI